MVLRLHVQPGAGRTAVSGRYGDALKVRVAAPPDKGRANDACLALVADIFGVQPSALELTGGAASRTKRIAVAGVDPADARRLLAVALAGGSGAGPMPDVHDLGR